LLVVGQVQDTAFSSATQRRAPMRRIDSQGQGETAIQIQAPEVSLGQIDDLVAMRVRALHEVAQGGGLPYARFTHQQPPRPGCEEEPLEALA